MSITQQDVAYAIKHNLPLNTTKDETIDYYREYNTNYQRNRYQNDPIYREKRKAITRAYIKKHKSTTKIDGRRFNKGRPVKYK